MKKILFLLLLLPSILSSCSQKLKDKIGLSSNGPDEHSVQKNNELEIPPHFRIEELESSKNSEKR